MSRLYILFLSCLWACNPNPSKINDEQLQSSPSDGSIKIWWSSELMPESSTWFTNPPPEEEISYKLQPQPAIGWQEQADPEIFTIKIDPTKTYQSILGIGMALEGTTLYAMRKGKSETEIEQVIKAFIDPKEGIGLNLFRLPIGSCDFSDGRAVSDHPKGFYSYRDTPQDTFSIQKDIDLGKIEMIKKVQEVAANLDKPQKLTFFASAWSPPAWMKSSGNLIGGTLKEGYAPQLAAYFRKFVEAYEAVGIPIYAITMQNEPNFVPPAYPGMKLSPQQEAEIVEAVYKEFHENLNGKRELHTELWINDHNFEDWKNADEVLQMLKGKGRQEIVNAVAFHNYIAGDSVSFMSKLKGRYPAVDMQLTEHSEWGTQGMYNIQTYFQHYARSYMYWVAMTSHQLDEHNQSPYNRIGALSPTLLIEDPTDPAAYYATPEYYLLGQFAKFIRPGAVRLTCDMGSVKNVTAVAFENPNGERVCVLVNQSREVQPFQMIVGNRSFQHALPKGTVGTYVWTSD